MRERKEMNEIQRIDTNSDRLYDREYDRINNHRSLRGDSIQ